MRTSRLRRIVLVTGVLLAGCSSGGQRAVRVQSVLLDWFDQTAAAVAAQGPEPDPVAARTWALAWWAADRASAGMSGGPAADAAVATAVHDVLLALAPSRRDALDRALNATHIPRTAATADACVAGRRAAVAVLEERRTDGLSLAAVERPRAAPGRVRLGVWRPTPPGFGPPAEGGLPMGKPFLLRSASQLRPAAPPQPASATYRRDLMEVASVGQDRSTTRTAAQTDVALFWAGSELEVQRRILRAALVADHVATVAGARLLSAYHRVTVDAEIAAFDAKYAYQKWRPVTAIRLGDGVPTDGVPQPGWAPLIPTPSFAEYPSAHTVYAGAAAAVLQHFLGAAPAGPLTVSSPTLADKPRVYTSWQQSVQENVDARVFAGIHFRSSDVAGSALGRAVALYDLARLR